MERTQKRLPALAFAMLGFLSFMPLRAETRVALVIGNADYINVPLRNPVNDAKDLAESLKKMGFSVTLVVDGDIIAMNRAIRDFGNAIKKPDAVALFYYSGHGIQYQGANYLVPARADVQDADELSFAAINVEQIYSKMQSAKNKTNIIILDACRNNPFPGTERALERGLAVVGTVQPPQSLIVYATAPGKTAQDGEGRNGAFTAALLRHIADPGLDAELMIRRVREDVVNATGGVQVPWHNSSITGAGFAFAGGGILSISTDPTGAEIFIDGKSRGAAPLTLSDLPRYTEFEVSAKSGNRSVTQKLLLEEATERRLDLRLEALRGDLSVKASEADISAFLNGQPVVLDPSGLVKGLEVGTYSLELRGASSEFKASVEVVAGKTTTVSAALVPMGALTLTLPPGVSCSIEGPGRKDSTSAYNYGSLPAGRYVLTVSGGDYEPYAETVSIERGKTCSFAPRLRYSLAYLSSRYEMELRRIQAIVDSGVASQADVEDAGILARKIRAEARPELAQLASTADQARAKLEALRPVAPPAVPSAPTAAQVGATGPAQLYAAYSAELAELEKAGDSAVSFGEAEIEAVQAFQLKAQAQPYVNFQALAARAGALRDRMDASLRRRQIELWTAEYETIVTYRQPAFAENGLERLESLLEEISSRKRPETEDLRLKLSALRLDLVSLKAAYDRELKLDELTMSRDQALAKYEQTVKKRKGGTAVGLTLLIGGGLDLAASALCTYLSLAAYGDYSAATTSAEAERLREKTSAWNAATAWTLGAGCTLATIGSISFLARANPKPFKLILEDLDRQIDELGGSK